MGKVFQVYLEGDRLYTCSNCHAHLAVHEDIVSKAFQGRHGRAYLFSNVANVTEGTPEERVLLTGRHTVADIKCVNCETVVGWKYINAFVAGQKYKENKYIMEKAKICKENSFSAMDLLMSL